jgi:hypothetical protein
MVLDDEVAALALFLGDGHAQAGVRVGRARLRGPGLVDVEVLAVDGGDGALPACEGLFQLEVDRVDYVVAVAGEEGVWFLLAGGEYVSCCWELRG